MKRAYMKKYLFANRLSNIIQNEPHEKCRAFCFAYST